MTQTLTGAAPASPAIAAQPCVQLTDVSFTYTGQSAPSLDHVSLEVAAGECVLVCGASGCGKSTLLRCLNGLVPQFFEGELSGDVRAGSFNPKAAPLYEEAGISGTVFQNPRTQFYTTDTTSELAFTLENRGMQAHDIIERLNQTVAALALDPLMDRSMFALSGGERQQIACGCVHAADVSLVLMDEPTANLDWAATQRLARIVQQWVQAGKTVLIAEHRLAWMRGIARRVVVMQNGGIVKDMPADQAFSMTTDEREALGLRQFTDVDPQSITLPAPTLRPGSAYDVPGTPPSLPGGSALEGRQPAGTDALPSARRNPAAPASLPDTVTLENLHFARKAGSPLLLDLDSVALYPGKVGAIVGPNGRGKTTLLRCLAGLERRDKSVLRVGSESWGRKERLRNTFLIAQDVNYQLFTQSVYEEVDISLPDDTQALAPEAREARVREILAALGLASQEQRDPTTLSGGERQRCAIACAVASERRILLFDEPTSGLDLAHMRGVATLLRQLAEAGRIVLVVTHDTELIQECADYLVRLR